MDGFDWNQMRGFIAAAETGTLSAAGRRLGLTQPTLSRQVAALEQRLGLTLFERVGRQLVLTEAGHGLLHHGRRMAEAAEALALSASGHAESVSGTVSISAGDAMSVYALPPIVATIRRIAPQITIELVVSNALSDLRRREADIAVRHVEPTEPDLVGRRLRYDAARFYAAPAWIARNGHPRAAHEVTGADFIGYEPAERYAAYLRGMGIDARPDAFRTRTGDTVAAWQLARQGLGVCAMARDIAGQFPEMVPVLDDLPSIEVPIWLVTHRELRTSRRIRLVFDVLAEELSRPVRRRPLQMPGVDPI